MGSNVAKLFANGGLLMYVSDFFRVAYVHLSVMCLFFAGGFVIERLAPVDKITVRDRLLNSACGVLFGVVDILAAFYLGYILGPVIAHPLITIPFSDHHHVIFAFLLTLFWAGVRDFLYYWFHRCQHASKWLWAEHALHHSDTAVNVTTAVRHHWLEMPLNLLFIAAPLGILFKPPAMTVPIAYVWVYFIGYLIHCNVRLNAGPLAKIVVSPQNHRIHHSREARHINKNFAQFFSFWDVIFGTYYAPAAEEFPQTGLCSGETVHSLAGAAFMPFRMWAQMLRPSGEVRSKAATTTNL